MKRSKLVVSVFAAALFATSALGLAACSKEPSGKSSGGGTGGGGSGGGGGTTYTITFDANGGTFAGNATRTTRSDGTLASLPTAANVSYDSDHEFEGWYTLRTGGTQITATYKFTSSITVFAHWKDVGGGGGGGDDTGEFTVTFYANNGTNEKQEVKTDSSGKLSQSSIPTFTYTAHTFDGWSDASTGGSTVDVTKTFTSDADVYATWKPDETVDREIDFGYTNSAAFKFQSGETIVISYSDDLPTWADPEAPFVHFWIDGDEWTLDCALDQSTYTVDANLSAVTFMVAFKQTDNGWTSWKKTDDQSGASFANGQEYIYDAQADAEGNMSWVEGEDGVFVYALTNKAISYK